MGLLRASCDLLLLRRLKAETQQEYRAVQGLTASLDNGGDLITALDAAEHELLKAERERVLPELRQRCDQLSDCGRVILEHDPGVDRCGADNGRAEDDTE